jgi:hypothetical protein
MTKLGGLLQEVRKGRETLMQVILLSSLALGILTSAALAEQPLALSYDQMDKIAAGKAEFSSTPPSVVNTPGSSETVYPRSPEVRCCGIETAIKHDQLGHGGYIQTPGAASITTPGLPSNKF